MGNIVKETRHGNGGRWVIDAEKKPTARGFLSVVKAENSAQKGVGGYITRIRFDDKVLMGDPPSTLEEAQALIDYAHQKQDAEYPTWASLID